VKLKNKKYMKVDNFDLIKKHIHSSDSNEFYMLQIMRRTKDQKGYDGKHKQSIIKTYFISSVEYLDSKRDEIVGLCEMFNARAYINLNKKSYKQVSLKALEILAGKIAHEEYDIRSLFESACGQTGACDGQKTWIVDFDSKDLDELDRIKNIIDSIDPKGVSKIIETVPTRHGYHLITRPFNKKAFYEMYNESIDIHDNNPTLVFVNLKDDENE
jgi:hypothetical protein